MLKCMTSDWTQSFTCIETLYYLITTDLCKGIDKLFNCFFFVPGAFQESKRHLSELGSLSGLSSLAKELTKGGTEEDDNNDEEEEKTESGDGKNF